ncbi:MAG: AI-2E family transporter [Bacteroidota bacterium]
MKNLAYSVIGIGGVLALLILANSILIPFVYGIVVWFLASFIKNQIKKIPFLKNKVPNWIINSITFLFILVVLSLVSSLINSNITSLLSNSDAYAANLKRIVDDINGLVQIDLSAQITSIIESFDYIGILGSLADNLSGTLGDVIMIALYAVFIFSEESVISDKVKKVFKNPEEYAQVTAILKKINNSTSDYIRLKTQVSILTGGVGYIFLLLMGVDAAFFWAFLIFALNYIPTIGSLTATLFPAIFSLAQFGEIEPFSIILVGLGVIQWFIGNVLEPKIMGRTLNLSPLVTILALIIWGEIWGITGMLLSVPITVVMVIIFSQFDSTKPLAILLSETGEIDEL